MTDTDLHFTTEHTEALNATDLTLLNGEGLIARSEYSADGSDDDRLTGSHIRRTADDLQRSLCTYIYCRDVEMVGVLVHIAGQYVTDDESLESTRDRFDFFYTAHLETDGRQGGSDLLGGQRRLHIGAQ